MKTPNEQLADLADPDQLWRLPCFDQLDLPLDKRRQLDAGVALIARMAVAMGFRVAVTKTAIEGWSTDWHGCVYIGLPTGQVSWHFHDSQASLFYGLPRGHGVWDGHDTPEKYRRVDTAFLGASDDEGGID